MKRLFKILRNVLITLILLLVALYFAIRTPAVQTWITQRIAGYLSDELGTTVMVGGVDIDLWARLILEDVYIEDQKQDTLAFIHALRFSSYKYDDESGRIDVYSAQMEQPYFNLIRHEGDTVLNYKFIADYIASLSQPEDSSGSLLFLHNVSISDGRVNYINENRDIRDRFGIDWNHIGATHLNVKVHELAIVGDSIHAGIENLSLSEKSGFELRGMTSEMVLVPGELRLSDASIYSNRSEIRGDLAFGFESLDDFDSFEQRVKMKHDLRETRLYMGDLAYFSSDLLGWDEEMIISGKFRGKISALKGRDVEIRIGKGTRFKGKFDMDGLPEIDQTFIILDIDELTTNKRALDSLQIPPFETHTYLKTPDNFNELGQITYRGNFTGFINDFASIGTISTAIGNVNTDIALRYEEGIDDYVYKGGLATNRFDLGKFYNSSDLGELSCNLTVEGTGLQLKKMNADFDGEISSLELNGYAYKNIVVEDGKFALRKFDGDFRIEDENLVMDFNGQLDFNSADPTIDFTADIRHLNLQALHILENYRYHSLSGKVSAQSVGFDIERFVGFVELEDVSYCVDTVEYHIDSLRLVSERFGEPHIQLASDFAKADIRGDFDVLEIGPSILEIVSGIVPSLDPPVREHRTQNFKMTLTVYDASQITEIFLPDLVLPKDTTFLRLEVDEPRNTFSLSLSTDSIRYNGYKVEGLTLDAQKTTGDAALYVNLISDRLWLEGNGFADFSLDTRTEVDSIYAAMAWGDNASDHSGDINGKLTVKGYETYDFLFGRSSVTVKGKEWTIRNGSFVSMDKKEILVSNFELGNREQWIRINGNVSEDPLLPLNFEINLFDVSYLNTFVGGNPEFHGILSGTAAIRDIYHNFIFTNDITLDKFSLNNYYMGNLDLESSWDNVQKQLRLDGILHKDTSSDNAITRLTPLMFSGYYRPYNEESPLDVTATIKDFDLAFINEFMSPGVIDIHGLATGTIAITGQPEAPQLEGDVFLADASIFVHYLNTKYIIEQHIGISPDMFTFDHIRIRDQENNPGFLTGQILHNSFSEWNFDLFIEMQERMLVMNTNEQLNPQYYGKAYTTGNVGIYGYEDQLEFDCTLKTEPGTVLYMPMGNTSEQTFENFVRFVDSDSIKVDTQRDLSGIKLNFDMEITPDAEFQIIFDEAVGDIIKARGQGHILMEINSLSTFNMYGLVEVVQGDYTFTLKNLVKKEFTLKPGGTIAWYGDPFSADLDLQALYKVSASLYDIIPDPKYAGGQRVPVDLVMHLTGKMLNPGVEFDVALPTVDQITRSRVNSIISTDQERNRQAFALLVLRRFVSPPNVSSDHNNTSALGATSTELLSNQVSNWLSQLSDDFDLGFNYRPGDDISNEEIAIALSTQLFNERLSLSSNVGVSRSTSSLTHNTNNLIGDIRIEYKITPEGQVCLVVYNESSDFRMTTTQQSPYTQGVGVLYQQDFDNMEDFWNGFRNILRTDKTGD